MPTFQYRGVDGAGTAISGEVEARDDRAAARELRSRRIFVTTLSEKRKAKGFQIRLFKGIPAKDLAVFTRQFSTMLTAGLPLVQCLRALAEQSDNKRLQEVLGQVASGIEAGKTLTAALRQFPGIFDDLYVNLVHAGETGGALDTMLKRLAVYVEKAQALKRKVKMALIYPIAVLGVASAVSALLLIFVIPVFARVYAGVGVALPLPTKIVMELSVLLRKYFLLVAGVIVGVIFLFRAYYRTDGGRRLVDRLLLRTPIFGLLIRKIAVARFTRTLSTLVGGGVPILDALTITAKTAGNRVVEDAILTAKISITAGETISGPLKASGVFPPMVTQMVSVGEQTGSLESMLAKVGDYYDEEVDTAVSGLTSLLEPFLIVFLGVVVGGIVIAMYLPIFKLATVIGK